MRAKFKCRRSAFHTTENRIGMNKQSQREREGAKGNGANTSSTHHSFPSTGSWKVVQIIFVLILAPDSPNFNRKEGMALQHFLGGMSVTTSVTNTITNLISYVNQ